MTPDADPSTEVQTRMFEEFINGQKQMVKAFDLMLNPPRVEVGTTRCEEVFRKNRMRLLHYFPLEGDGGTVKKKHATPLLVIYAVINRPYILDLEPDKSVVRRFLEKGFDVYMIEWGYPTRADQYMCLDDYIQSYIDPAVDFIRETSGSDKVSMLGYCIGGYFTTVYSAIHPDKVANLMVMAAPLDFHIGRGLLHKWSGDTAFDPQKVVSVLGNAPDDFLNVGFMMLDPLGNTFLKYYNLMKNIGNDKFVENFLRMEKWLGDGIEIPGRFYVEFIKEGYQENRLVNGRLSVEDRMVDLKDIDMPVLIIVGKHDHLVPMESTKALADLVSSKTVETMEFGAGHIGVSVGGRAHRELWPKVVDWLADPRSGPTGGKG